MLLNSFLLATLYYYRLKAIEFSFFFILGCKIEDILQ